MSTNSSPPGDGFARIGLVQMRCEKDPARNLERALGGIREASQQGAQIICLPELFLSEYFCQTEDHRFFDLAEPIPGPTTDRLGQLAAELEVVIVASLFEKRAAGLYHNTAAVIDADGGLLGTYRKMHIPDDPLFYEKFYFTPGDLGFRVFSTRFARIGVLICWDQWFPEAARLTALTGGGNSLLSHGDRLASERKRRIWSGSARQLGVDSAVPRRGQWLFCRGGQPSRA